MKQLILARCEEVVARAKQLYGMDLSQVKISFNLRGRSAGKAGGKGYRMPGSAYYVKFNADMLTRDAADHVHDDTVPHEFAHVVCFMDPSKGRNHDYGWARVCRELGGSGARTHSEEVVYGKGATYEYTTDRGNKVRMSEKYHQRVRRGETLRYKRGLGNVTAMCAYSIVGYRGQTLQQPLVKQTPNHPARIEAVVAERRIAQTVVPTQQTVVPRVAVPGESKAATSRRIMLSGYRGGESYEAIINAMMTACGYNRQLARGTFKANADKVGIPATFG